MKLKSLYIEDYKNIKKQTFNFSDNTGYITLIGLNGSGKSNLLEAISLIFNGLINNKKIPFYYEFQYEHKGRTYLRKPRIAMIDGVRAKDSDMIYPSSVIACYSGEDLRLWHESFEDYYMHYFNQAIKNSSFSPQLIYINRYCWKIAFITLFCSERTETRKFLKDCLHIKDLTSINCRFIVDVEKRNKFKEHNALKWFNRIEALQKEDANNLINANTIRTIDMSMYGITNPQKKCQYIFQYLYLLSLPERNPDKGQMVDKLIEEIKVYIDGIDFDALSEGEKKMILIESITQILGDERSLILLDEPDAHVHVEYKKKMLEAISSFNGQTVFTTHSPILANLIQKEQKKNIILLRDGKAVDTDVINKLSEISGEEIDFISSSVVVGSKYILIVEGISDVRCLTKAIEVWSKKVPNYKKLESVKFLSAGGTGDVKDIFTDVLCSQMNYIEKVVFLFDIDDAGKKGHAKIDELIKEQEYKQFATKIEGIYYNNDITKNFELEDLFPYDVYKHIVDNFHKLKTYRDFKNRSTKTTSEIKDYIKEKASTFKDEWYDGFKPVLDKLIEVFDLN